MVSVVVPCYNRGSTVFRAVDSILQQTILPSEIIIVDDGSTDDTISVVRSIASELIQIIVLPHNQGAQAARAAGVKAAKGEWIAFLDSDDWWLPQKLEWQLAKAAEGYSVVHGGALRNVSGVQDEFPIPPLEGNIFSQLLCHPAPLYPCLLVKRECFERAGYPDPAINAYQEWDMSLLLARYYSFGYVDKPLFVYEVQKDSISRDDYRGLRGYEQIVCKWWKEILKEAGKDIGFQHYQALASQANSLTGLWGWLHYTFLGVNRTGKNCSMVLAKALYHFLRKRF